MPAVGFLADTLEASGGMEIAELQTAEGLARRGWDVVATATVGGGLSPRWARIGPLTEVGPVAGLSGPERASQTERSAAGFDAVVRALDGVDVVYSHAPATFDLAAAAGRALRRPVVLHLHLPPFTVRTGWRAVRGRTRAGLEPAALRAGTSVARLLVVSEAMRTRWVQAGVDRRLVHVVRNGVDLERFRPASPAERRTARAALGLAEDVVVLGFLGRLQATKGIEQLLEAFGSLLRRTSHPVRLVVAGGPSRFAGGEGVAYERALRAQAPAGVDWIGWRPDTEAVLRALDLLVVPSRWEEPFGLVAAEGLAAGLPVVASRRGGLPEVLGPELSGLLVPPRPGPLARALGRLVDRPDERARLGRAGRARAREALDRERMLDGVEAHLAAVRFGTPRRWSSIGVRQAVGAP
jgi:glycosyltransferase involved in cell wall biosynthesis